MSHERLFCAPFIYQDCRPALPHARDRWLVADLRPTIPLPAIRYPLPTTRLPTPCLIKLIPDVIVSYGPTKCHY